jgi:RNA polymerase sigma factor (TIGR02999 family)
MARRLTESPDITELLRRWSAGDSGVLDQLIPVVYEPLRALAHARLRSDPDASINTTGLVHEAYLRLAGSARIDVRDRGHFLGLASRVMRRVLVDHARSRIAARRGLGAARNELEADAWLSDAQTDSVIELDDALKKLEKMDSRRCHILEQRYFGGLTLEETARALGVSLATVKREIRSARAWLALELGREAP